MSLVIEYGILLVVETEITYVCVDFSRVYLYLSRRRVNKYIDKVPLIFQVSNSTRLQYQSEDTKVSHSPPRNKN